MDFPTIGESTPLLIALGVGYRWWTERRDSRSDLAEAEREAEKTVKTLTETVEDKNDLLVERENQIERRDRRIAHLETLLFSRQERR